MMLSRLIRLFKRKWLIGNASQRNEANTIEIDPTEFDILPKGKFVFGAADQFLLVRKNRYRVNLLPGQEATADFGIGWLTEQNTPQSYDRLWGDESAVAAFRAEADGVRERMPAEIFDAAGNAVDRANAIIDIGCGVGDLLLEARRRKPNATLFGCDFSPAAIEHAREALPDADIRELHFDKTLDYKSNAFDLVLCTDVLEHLEYPEAIIEELVRICAPGGAVVLVIPDGDVDQFLGHLWFWNEESFRKFLSKWSGTVWRLPVCREFVGLIRV